MIEGSKIAETIESVDVGEPFELSDRQLASVVGGKVTFHDLSFTHKIDKASPILFQA